MWFPIRFGVYRFEFKGTARGSKMYKARAKKRKRRAEKTSCNERPVIPGTSSSHLLSHHISPLLLLLHFGFPFFFEVGVIVRAAL